MRMRRALAVAAIAVFSFFSLPLADGWLAWVPAQAKQSNGNAGGNGNNEHGAGNGNGHARPKANLAPVADAGADRATSVGQTVVLDGSGSVDPDGDPALFTWEIVAWPAGSLAQLDDSHAVRPAFTADMPGDYRIELTLDDGYQTGAPDEVVVSTGNVAPAADAGDDRSVVQGATVQLDGANSGDANGNRISFNWTLVEVPEDSGAAISNPNEARPSFLADLRGEYVVELAAGDGWITGAPDRVIVSTGNIAPAANAGADLRAVVSARHHDDDEDGDDDGEDGDRDDSDSSSDSYSGHDDGETGGLIALDAELSGDSNGDEVAFRWTVLSAPDGARYRIRNS
ncbi:MAG: PKD domain-containing protein, partial [Alphaproteobacteria bacterium]|nr:PKD domain-containing protein [Alphaproteobacteria bacterium]